MPWIWNPFFGKVWVDAHRGKKTAGQGSKTRIGSSGTKNRDEVHPEPSKEIADEPKKDFQGQKLNPESSAGADDLLCSNLENKFDQVAPGVFKFKHSNALPLPKQNYSSDLNKKFPVTNYDPALPGDIGKYKRVGTAGDGTPVFTFT